MSKGKTIYKAGAFVFAGLLLVIYTSCRQGREIHTLYSNNNAEIEIKDTWSNPQNYPEEIYADYTLKKDVKYGEAKGYYISNEPQIPESGKFSFIIKEAFNIFGKTGRKPEVLPLHMDIYTPNSVYNEKNPVLVFVHGGGFFFGDKRNKLQKEITDNVLDSKFTVISIDYRLGAKLWGFNDIKKAIYCSVQDVRAALRYVTHYADELNIDPERLYLAGSSAGGIIALQTAFMDEDEVFACCERKNFKNKFGQLNDSGNSLETSYKLAGVISMWGSITDLNMIDERNNIPTLLFHGTKDNILYNDSGTPLYEYLGENFCKSFFKSEELYGSGAIYQYMRERNMPVKYIAFSGYNHAPHEEKDGTFNHNIAIVNYEINDFLHSAESTYLSRVYLDSLKAEKAIYLPRAYIDTLWTDNVSLGVINLQ